MNVSSNNKKLTTNLILMFLVYFMPKIFSFFLVPVYTAYLTTDEYGIADLIASTASLLMPFVSLATPNAVMRFTIENKEDIRPFQISLKVYIRGVLLLCFGLVIEGLIFNTKPTYLMFVFLTVATSILADINMSYTRGVERMKLITICGIGSSLVGICCNILLIVVFRCGVIGFLIASISGYIFQILLLTIANRNKHLYKEFIYQNSKELQDEMLKFSVPLIFSGLSWWVISSSDRYFVAIMCGAAANGVYAVAYKIPIILQAMDNVFGQAWTFTVYDSYKTEEGRHYIEKVNDFYYFLICFVGSSLISGNIVLSKILYNKEFFVAWKYVPFLLLSVVFSATGGLMSIFLSIYKKTRVSMFIALTSAICNLVLNYIFITVMKDAIGAAVATAVTFLISWTLYTFLGMKYSGVKIYWKKHIFSFLILFLQIMILFVTKNMWFTGIGTIGIVCINWKNILFLKEKKISLFRRG